jgi:hypothetical protein
MNLKDILEQLEDNLKKIFKEDGEGGATALGGTTADGVAVNTGPYKGTSSERIAIHKMPMAVDSDALVKPKGSHDKVETDANAKKLCSKCKKEKGKCKCPKKKK